jgi:hypothetical protein
MSAGTGIYVSISSGAAAVGLKNGYKANRCGSYSKSICDRHAVFRFRKRIRSRNSSPRMHDSIVSLEQHAWYHASFSWVWAVADGAA